VNLTSGYGESCFLKRLSKYYDISSSDRLLLKALEEKEESFKAGESILKVGAEARYIYLVKEGWVKYHTSFNNGETSVSDIKLPGDLMGLFAITSRQSITNITAIDAATICPFPVEKLQELFRQSPRLAMIFFSMLSRENSFLIERIKGVGKIEAIQQVAYFILLLALRVGDIHQIEENRFYWPIDQSTFGDLLGLSSVHINRCLTDLKQKKLIEYSRSSMKVLDIAKLEQFCEFNKVLKNIDYSGEIILNS
jgi:CRP/FNR family transcriptional regulator, anaerobic regulatory protein